MTMTRRLRELFASDRILTAPGAYDAISARLAARAGFDAVYVTGAGTVNAHFAVPDVDLISAPEMAQNVARITDAIDVPVFCDADTGYGNALATQRTVRMFERAGAAGLHLEDQVSPKRCGHLAGKRLVSIEEMEGKIEAACEARRDSDFVVIARTDARSVEGLDASIDRAGRYVQAGADVVFTEALTSHEEFGAFAAAIEQPLLANMTEFGSTPLLAVTDFQELGYAAVIFPMTAFRMMLRAVGDAYEELFRSGTQAALLDRMRTREELYDVLDYDAYEAAQDRLVRESERPASRRPVSP